MSAADNEAKRLNRSRERELRQRLAAFNAANPDACPKCKCRPGEGDAEDGSDHESFCPHQG